LNQTFSDEATLDINRENALFTLQSDTTNWMFGMDSCRISLFNPPQMSLVVSLYK
jgi:hypothetical protein